MGKENPKFEESQVELSDRDLLITLLEKSNKKKSHWLKNATLASALLAAIVSVLGLWMSKKHAEESLAKSASQFERSHERSSQQFDSNLKSSNAQFLRQEGRIDTHFRSGLSNSLVARNAGLWHEVDHVGNVVFVETLEHFGISEFGFSPMTPYRKIGDENDAVLSKLVASCLRQFELTSIRGQAMNEIRPRNPRELIEWIKQEKKAVSEAEAAKSREEVIVPQATVPTDEWAKSEKRKLKSHHATRDVLIVGIESNEELQVRFVDNHPETNYHHTVTVLMNGVPYRPYFGPSDEKVLKVSGPGSVEIRTYGVKRTDVAELQYRIVPQEP